MDVKIFDKIGSCVASGQYLDTLLERYLSGDTNIDESWVSIFSEFESDTETPHHSANNPIWDGLSYTLRSSDTDDEGREFRSLDASFKEYLSASVRTLAMIRAYRARGHLIAKFDPLGLEGNEKHQELDPTTYGLSSEDMSREVYLGGHLGLKTATVGKVLELLRQIYCGSIGVEFMHMQEPEEKFWIQETVERLRSDPKLSADQRYQILEKLTEAESLEKFLDRKYTGTKRFGLEGGESLIPAIEQILSESVSLGVEEAVLGMAHRGRLNVLTNNVRKPYRTLFKEFRGGTAYNDDVQGSGDVKYHLGASSDRSFNGKTIRVSLTPNPSHLEMVGPVVMGRVRAKQWQRDDEDHKKVMGIVIHGDAAFAGQGIVSETLTLSRLSGYRTGGTIHLIANNQIGFTTSPCYSRSSEYPSDVAKMVQSPIFHVNGDDPEAVIHAINLAVTYRHKFGRDVVVDIVCYRRQGHNEVDEPSFTQPIMYRAIKEKETTKTTYAQKLVQDGVLGKADIADIDGRIEKALESAYEESLDHFTNVNWLTHHWSGFNAFRGDEEMLPDLEGVPIDKLELVGYSISETPDELFINRKVSRQLSSRRKMIESGEGIDWSMAEALAFGTLLIEGTAVRLSGQDSGRGTFSQRHSVLVDQESELKYLPLNHLEKGQSRYDVIDSPLSEMSVLGYEYGYSLTEPNALVLWEAQFGDFANGAQVIIDQFITGGESKWHRMSGLVMLLPHGYEGQGPEHSSARVERYLQLCAEENIQVANCTSPANYFHLLRRQVRRNFRKPLIVFTPKSLLRHKKCVSPIEDFGLGSHFMRVIPEQENIHPDKKVRRVVICSGKVYFDLVSNRGEKGIEDVALVRVEQLYPWPKYGVKQELERYPNAEIVWCQEEPANMGPWSFVFPRLLLILEEIKSKQSYPGYAGRSAASSPATGFMRKHIAEQKKLVEQALNDPLDSLPRPFERVVV